MNYRTQRTAKRSCPGLNPRGGGSAITRLLRRFFIVSLVQHSLSPVTGVRVGSVPTALPEAQNYMIHDKPTTCAKPSGNLDFSGPYLGVVRKRAYKRACDRAALRGGTYYRGVWHTARSLQALRVSPVKEECPATAAKPARVRTRARPANAVPSRVHVLSWNAGGLSLAMFDELVLLLNTSEYQHVSAVVIQETHWKHESTWRASGWSCVHS